MKKLILIILSIVCSTETIAQNKVLYFQTSWGFEGTPEAFIKKAKASGYDGIEIWSPTNKKEQIQISKLLKEQNMKVIYLCGSDPNLSFKKGLAVYKKYLKNTFELNPIAINSHTGSDFYSFSQNMAFIEEATKLSKQYKIPVYHETHRGRFSYSLPKTIEYLEKDKDLVLTLDVSHWMVVHESLLIKRTDLLKKIINRKNQLIEMTRKKDIDQDALVLTQTKPKTKKPSMYKVLLLNDDFTPMEFVVHILERFFNIDHQQAVSIMLTIHQKGLAVVGVYPHEIAETKVAQVMEFSRKNQHPLQCTMEKE